MGNAMDELKKIPAWGWVVVALIVVGGYIAVRRSKSKPATATTSAGYSPTTGYASAQDALSAGAPGIDLAQMQGISQLLQGIMQTDTALTQSVAQLQTSVSAIPGAGTGATSPPPTAVPHDSGVISVAALYQDMLGHSPDAAGAAFWQSYTPSTLFEAFAATPEAQAFAQANPKAYVQGEYQARLHRAADPAGEAYWVGQLSGGAAQQAAAFARSAQRESAVTAVTA